MPAMIEAASSLNNVQMVTHTVTFDGTAGKGRVIGDNSDNVELIGVPADTGIPGLSQGIIVLRLEIIVLTSLVGAAGTTLAIASTGPYYFDAATDISTLTAGVIWTAGAATTGSVALGAASTEIVLSRFDPYVVAVPAVHDITGGSIRCDLYYLPLGVGATGVFT